MEELIQELRQVKCPFQKRASVQKGHEKNDELHYKIYNYFFPRMLESE